MCSRSTCVQTSTSLLQLPQGSVDLGKRIVILDGLKEVLRQQKAIGNNLNQLAVLANMGKVQFANLDSAVQEFARINTALREMQEGGAGKSQSSIS